MTTSKKKPKAVVTDPKPVIRRAKRKNGDTSKYYFTMATQDAIVRFQKCEDKKTRDAIYVKEIMPALEKLVENLINIHKFSGLYDSYEDLKNDCVNFLFETLPKFDSTRGTAAFGYVNVCAKNWLIIRAKQKANKFKRNVSIDDQDALTNNELKIIEEQSTVLPQDTLFENEVTAKNVVRLLQEIRAKSKSENELLCINSIITIFESIDSIDFMNKSAVLLYMRELRVYPPKLSLLPCNWLRRAIAS
jgi:hypothetical protein